MTRIGKDAVETAETVEAVGTVGIIKNGNKNKDDYLKNLA